LPVVKTGDDVAALAGKQVQVEGIYQQQDVRMRPIGQPVYLGHVAVVLDDETPVFLYPPDAAEARRSADEIQRFDDKRVRVSGLLYPTIPSEDAMLQAPCLVEVGSVVLTS
jgi:hypothetical protein